MAEYVIGKYIRLSQADRDLITKREKSESESISHQRDLLQNFINSHGEFQNCKQMEFFDDGYSGTNFERPAFEKMIEKVKQSEINCIIVKDFSRFGRNYIELGDYLERIFPYLGIRFISVNDGYDSADYKGTTGGLDVVMKNIVYDYYSKDLSVKVSTAKRHKMKQGEYLGGHVPYGLKKHDTIKNKLAIDEEVADIIREIFGYAIDGISQTEIARILNDKGYETPGAYYRRKHPGSRKFSNTSLLSTWTVINVRAILRQEMYYGATVGHKREKVAVNSKVTRQVPKEEQIIVEGMHEAIISKETFLQAQKIFKTGYKKKTEGYCDYPLKGKVRCGCCKRAMTHRFKKVGRKDYAYFRCVYSMYQNGANCCKHYTKESVVNETILQSIKRMVELSDKVAEGLKLKKEESKTNATELIKQIAALQQKLEKCNSEKFANIDDFMAGNLKKELYQKRRSELTELAGQLESSITKKEQELQDVQLAENKELEIELQKIGGYADVNELDKRMVQDFIDVVYVYDPEHVEIVWEFSDELKELLLDDM